MFGREHYFNASRAISPISRSRQSHISHISQFAHGMPYDGQAGNRSVTPVRGMVDGSSSTSNYGDMASRAMSRFKTDVEQIFGKSPLRPVTLNRPENRKTPIKTAPEKENRTPKVVGTYGKDDIGQTNCQFKENYHFYDGCKNSLTESRFKTPCRVCEDGRSRHRNDVSRSVKRAALENIRQMIITNINQDKNRDDQAVKYQPKHEIISNLNTLDYHDISKTHFNSNTLMNLSDDSTDSIKNMVFGKNMSINGVSKLSLDYKISYKPSVEDDDNDTNIIIDDGTLDDDVVKVLSSINGKLGDIAALAKDCHFSNDKNSQLNCDSNSSSLEQNYITMSYLENRGTKYVKRDGVPTLNLTKNAQYDDFFEDIGISRHQDKSSKNDPAEEISYMKYYRKVEQRLGELPTRTFNKQVLGNFRNEPDVSKALENLTPQLSKESTFSETDEYLDILNNLKSTQRRLAAASGSSKY